MLRHYDMDELAKLCEAKADMAIGDAKIVFASVARWLSLLPPADVVEVVRCKDCAYYVPISETGFLHKDKPAMHCMCHSRLVKEDGYCNEGIRRREDEDQDRTVSR